MNREAGEEAVRVSLASQTLNPQTTQLYLYTLTKEIFNSGFCLEKPPSLISAASHLSKSVFRPLSSGRVDKNIFLQKEKEGKVFFSLSENYSVIIAIMDPHRLDVKLALLTASEG